MEFFEALQMLADKAGVTLETNNFQKDNKKELYDLNELVSKFYSYMLTVHKDGAQALAYAKSERKLNDVTIKRFSIGYSPSGSFYSNYFLNKKKIKKETMDRAGLIYMWDNRVVDRFHDRLMFPLIDHRGNIVGFAGRILPWAKNRDKTGKYINSPDTIVHHKSELLFGLYQAKEAIRKTGKVFVCEGPLDAIAMSQAGIENVVAIQGTSFTDEQARLISRFTKNIVLVLDSDNAGTLAARRSIGVLEKEGCEVSIVPLVGVKDPDEAVQKNLEKFKKLLENPKGVWDFLVDSVFKAHQGVNGVEKSRISHELVPILASIQDSIVQAHYIGLAAKRLGVPVDAVMQAVRRGSTPVHEKIQREQSKSQEKKSRQELLEESFLVTTLLTDPSLVWDPVICEYIQTPFIKKVIDRVEELYQDNPNLSLAELVEKLPPELSDRIKTMLLVDGEQEELHTERERVIKELELLALKNRAEYVGREIGKIEEEEGMDDRLSELQREFIELTRKIGKREQS
jgi:DNA primase